MSRRFKLQNRDVHSGYLDALINRLTEVDETPKDIAWIMKEGVWMVDRGTARLQMPDIILCYYSHDYTLIELKGSWSKRAKAKAQLDSGEEFIKKFYVPGLVTKKFVVYQGPGYEYEVL
jgi:hypothetical protein